MPAAMRFHHIALFVTASLQGATGFAQADYQQQPQIVPASEPGLAVPPEGWAYLPELAILGPADIYSVKKADGNDGPAVQMHAHTANNAGILTRDAEAPLTDATTLSWQWKVDQIPSQLPETEAINHDYFSIAVKFENGKDLTYMWSSSLAKDFGFDCPLAGWTGREYHVVVRTGPDDLGKWLSEERNIAADYAKHVGGEMPSRITQVWLISNTLIQHGEANASFGDISINQTGSGTKLQVF